ncbi:MAG: mechanosensitive ion channel family protein [Bacteroidaceae bacterium]|nr:mechanosensitive ion channel family protein [Bacteroidaceae bacterium]MCR4835274.1 mechanosensitive ion channel family protein [Bacteroidaceae bacterium]
MNAEAIEQLLEKKVFGITLLDPIMFCLKAFAIFLLIQIAVWVIRFFMNPERAKRKNRKFDETSMVFFRKLLVTVVYILGLACVLYLIPPLRTFATSILASAGIMAMAIGLASQEALSNFVSGIFIILAKPFRIGDMVSLDSGQTGKVTEIAIRHTIITTAENRQVIVPNSKINSAIITNSTIKDTRTCVFVEVGVAYSENLDHCIDEMRKVIEADPRVLDKRTEKEKADGVEKVIIRVLELGSSSITLRAYVWAPNPADAFVLKCDLLKAVKDHYDEVGIEIPYPYMNVVRKA